MLVAEDDDSMNEEIYTNTQNIQKIICDDSMREEPKNGEDKAGEGEEQEEEEVFNNCVDVLMC